jgi:hypothetical protein
VAWLKSEYAAVEPLGRFGVPSVRTTARIAQRAFEKRTTAPARRRSDGLACYLAGVRSWMKIPGVASLRGIADFAGRLAWFSQRASMDDHRVIEAVKGVIAAPFAS